MKYLILFLLLVGCSIEPTVHNQITEYFVITYQVDTTEPSMCARIQFNNKYQGITQLLWQPLPYSYTFVVTNDYNRKLFISAQSTTNIGRLDLSIWINGTMYQIRWTENPYGYAFINGTIQEIMREDLSI